MNIPLSASTFQDLAGQEFALLSPNASLRALKLDSISISADSDQMLSFSLIFHGAPPLLAQGTYRLSHPKIGEVNLFIVPVGKSSGGFEYESVFNIMHETQPGEPKEGAVE